MRCREVIDPRQLSQGFSSTSLEGVTSSAVFGISAAVSVSPPHLPRAIGLTSPKVSPTALHTPADADWTLSTSILQRQSAWVTPTICGHLAAVLLTQWTVIAAALRWVPPSTVGAIAGLWWWDSTAVSDRAEVSCRSLCKQRHPGPQTWFAGLPTVAPAPTSSPPQTLQRPELARHHESGKRV